MSSITSTFSFDNTVFAPSHNDKLHHLFVRLKGGTSGESKSRLPLNISLVLDRSGSMRAEHKLDYAKKALEFVVQHLKPADQLSLVQYDDEVQALVPQGPVIQKQILLDRIKSIQPGGMTNLSGGMLEGYSQVSKTSDRQQMVNRVLLLSDGLANRGIRDPKKLNAIVSQQVSEARTTLSTFGVGENFDELLMQTLAEYGTGSYYFIGNADDIPTIFAEELNDLLEIIAQNIELVITYPATHFKALSVDGQQAEITPGSIRMRLGDMYAEEEKAVMIRLERQDGVPFDPQQFNFSLAYQDVANLPVARHEGTQIQLNPIEDVSLLAQTSNSEVLHQVAVYGANAQYKAVSDLVAAKKFDQARSSIKTLLSFLELQLKHFPDSAELANLQEQATQYASELEQMEKWDQAAMATSLKHHRSSANFMSKKKFGKLSLRQKQYMKEQNKGNKNV